MAGEPPIYRTNGLKQDSQNRLKRVWRCEMGNSKSKDRQYNDQKKKGQKNPNTIMIYKRLQWKLKIEQHEPHQKQRACTQVTRKGNVYMREITKCRIVERNITTIRSLLWKTICATIVIMCVYSNCWFSMEKHQLSCSIILYLICFDIFKPGPWL